MPRAARGCPPAACHRTYRRTQPGFGENLRVLQWVIERSKGGGKAEETPIGYVPTASDIDHNGIDISQAALNGLLRIESEGWRSNLRNQVEFFDKFGDRLPAGIREQHEALARRLRSK